MSDVKIAASVIGRDDPEYDDLLRRMQERIDGLNEAAKGKLPLFTTDAEGLWEAYLSNIPNDRRQHYNCHCCRRFVEAYGGLVVMDVVDFRTIPLFWNYLLESIPEELRASFVAMNKIVRKAKVTGVFFCSEKKWGQPVTGAWHHMAIVPPAALIHTKAIQTAFQAMAEKKEDHGAVGRALG